MKCQLVLGDGVVMNRQTLFAATAAAALLLGAAATANAQTTLTIQGSYTATALSHSNTPTIGIGNEKIDQDSGTSTDQETLSNPFTVSLNNNTSTNPMSTKSGLYASSNYLFSVNPATSCSFCTNDTITDTISADLTIYSGTSDTGTVVGTIDLTMYYEADYANDTDYIYWESSAGSYSGGSDNSTVNVVSASTADNGTGSAEFSVVLGDSLGTLDITLSNDYDWDLGTEISLDLIPTNTPTPEPASMVLFASGLAGLGALRRRRSRKAAATA